MRLELFLLSTCAVAAIAAQVPVPSPPRDGRPPAAAAPTTGDARLFGRVIDAETARPLRGAVVVAVPQRRSDGTIVADTRAADALPTATRTDAEGRFALADLAPGEYAVVARRDGYVQQQFGQAAPETPGRNLVVAMGAVAGPLEFALVRSAVISGRVVDAEGSPADQLTVQAWRVRGRRGVSPLRPHASAVTDDLGRFRVFGLPPGAYVVSAEPVKPSGPPGTFVSTTDRDLVPTFAPSATTAHEAALLRVGPGEEVEAHIHLVEATLATIEGRVLDSRGMPFTDAAVRLLPRGGAAFRNSLPQSTGDEGRFVWRQVAPGAYTLVVSPYPDWSRGGPPAAGSARPEFGSLDLDVTGDLTGVVVRTHPGATFRGRVVVDGDATPLRGRDVRVVATLTTSVSMAAAPMRAPLRPDATFELVGVHGPAVLRLANLPDGWWTRTVRAGSLDVTDGFEVDRSRQAADVEIVVSTKGSGLRGRVIATPGLPTDVVVIGFDDDARRWGRPVVANTFMVRPVEDGGWSIDRLRPGRYRLVSVSAARAGEVDLDDPEFLARLAPLARTVEVKEGETPRVDLEVVQP